MRDIEELDSMELRIHARAVNPAGPLKWGPGQVGVSVACGNFVCYSGDVIIGDRDGIIVIALTLLPALAAEAKLQDSYKTASAKKNVQACAKRT